MKVSATNDSTEAAAGEGLPVRADGNGVDTAALTCVGAPEGTIEVPQSGGLVFAAAG